MEGAGICWGESRVPGGWLARVSVEGDKTRVAGGESNQSFTDNTKGCGSFS